MASTRSLANYRTIQYLTGTNSTHSRFFLDVSFGTEKRTDVVLLAPKYLSAQLTSRRRCSQSSVSSDRKTSRGSIPVKRRTHKMSRVLTTSVRARWRMRVPVARVPAAMHSANVTNSRSLAASRQYHTVLVVSDHCRRSSPWNNESSSSSLSCSQRTPTVIRKRCFSKKHTKHLKIMEGDPFDVLKVSRADAYSKVKTAFLKVAMQHHPDTNAAGLSADERERSKDIFVEARKAFEAIVEDSQSGLAILKIESKDYVEEDDLDEWFRSETGYDMPFMDQATMKEVAKMTETMGGEAGLDRDGGMWTLARMVTASVKSGGDGKSILQLEAGDIRDRNINGILRRRRRW